MIKIRIQPADLAAIRFAYSPLLELTMSFRVWSDTYHQALFQSWLYEVRPALQGMAFPYMEAVITWHYNAAFMLPVPSGPIRSFEDDVARLQCTSEDELRREIQRILTIEPATPAREHFLQDPCGALCCLVGEVTDYWERALAPYWRSIMNQLESEILHQGRQFALNGAETTLAQLDHNTAFEDGLLTLIKDPVPFLPSEYTLKGDGFQLVPAIFKRLSSGHIRPQQRPMIMYTARGFGLIQQEETPDVDESLRLLVGEGKARILQALCSPQTTQELARKLSVSPSAISQHLRLLQQGGFVESHRSSYYVFYRLSARGQKLLEVFED